MRKLTDQDLTAIIGTVHHGFTIQKARIKGGGYSDSDHYGIVLGQNEKGNCVTWQFHLEDERFEPYWGHYIDSPETALKDYESRS